MNFTTASVDGETRVVLVDPAATSVWAVDDLGLADGRHAATCMTAFIAAGGWRRKFPMPSTRGRSIGDGVRLLAPIPHPRRDVICVGKNYRDHAMEFTASGFDSSASSAADAIPAFPIIFGKSAGSVIGPDDDILMHPGLDRQMDYEVELGVVIGTAGRGIRKEDALDHVFGYTIINDVTARDLQGRHKQWYLSKSFDGSCPMGPWIVTADQFDLASGRVQCRVNGEVRQDAATADMIFDVPTLIEVISAGMRLEPGDVIATGTPAGVALGFDPPRFLSEGDLVEVEITGIGSLSNVVRRADSAALPGSTRRAIGAAAGQLS